MIVSVPVVYIDCFLFGLFCTADCRHVDFALSREAWLSSTGRVSGRVDFFGLGQDTLSRMNTVE